MSKNVSQHLWQFGWKYYCRLIIIFPNNEGIAPQSSASSVIAEKGNATVASVQSCLIFLISLCDLSGSATYLWYDEIPECGLARLFFSSFISSYSSSYFSFRKKNVEHFKIHFNLKTCVIQFEIFSIISLIDIFSRNIFSHKILKEWHYLTLLKISLRLAS